MMFKPNARNGQDSQASTAFHGLEEAAHRQRIRMLRDTVVEGCLGSRQCFSKGVAGLVLLVVGLTLLIGLGCGPSSPSDQGQRIDRVGEASSPVRIGVVHMWRGQEEAPVVVGLRQGFKELGYVEGQDLVLEIRAGKGSYEVALEGARELVKDRVDVLVSAGTKSTQAAHKAVEEAAYDLPIVFSQVGEPVGAGFVQSLARPGGNTTGFSHVLPAITGKRLELLLELAPNARTVLVIFDPANPTSSSAAAEARQAAEQLSVQLQERHVKNRDEVLAVLQELDGATTDAILVLPDSLVVNAGEQIIERSRQERVPAIFHDAAWVRRGGLVSYGVSFVDLSRAAATYVDRVLKGAKPGDLPVQQPTTFELVVNQKAAEAIGMTFPESFLLQATEVVRN